jgi:hypothetical protein
MLGFMQGMAAGQAGIKACPPNELTGPQVRAIFNSYVRDYNLQSDMDRAHPVAVALIAAYALKRAFPCE